MAGTTFQRAFNPNLVPAATLPEQAINKLQLDAKGIMSVMDAPFNAKGDGTIDDLAALKSACDSAMNNGHDLRFPQGVYRVTGSLVVGSGIVQPLSDSVAATNANRSTVNANAVKTKYRPSLHFEAGAAIWGDFAPGSLTAIVDYQLEDSSGTLNDTASIVGLTVLGKEGWQSGAIYDPPGDNARTSVLQVGLHALRGARVIDRCRFRELKYGLVAYAAYWSDLRALWGWRCGTCFQLQQFNAGKVSQVLMQYSDVGLVIDGSSLAASEIHAENVREELVVANLESSRIGPAYFEDVSANGDGAAHFSVRLGVDTDLTTQYIYNSAFSGIRATNQRTGKRGYRVACLGGGVTFERCRDYGTGFDTAGSRHVGRLLDCSLTSFGTALNYWEWSIASGTNLAYGAGDSGSDFQSSQHFFFFFPSDNTHFQSIAAGSNASYTWTLPHAISPDPSYTLVRVYVVSGGNRLCIVQGYARSSTQIDIVVINPTTSVQSATFSAVVEIRQAN